MNLLWISRVIFKEERKEENDHSNSWPEKRKHDSSLLASLQARLGMVMSLSLSSVYPPFENQLHHLVHVWVAFHPQVSNHHLDANWHFDFCLTTFWLYSKIRNVVGWFWHWAVSCTTDCNAWVHDDAGLREPFVAKHLRPRDPGLVLHVELQNGHALSRCLICTSHQEEGRVLKGESQIAKGFFIFSSLITLIFTTGSLCQNFLSFMHSVTNNIL